MTKKYSSIIVPELEVDVANYITEIILKRKFKYKPDKLPKVEFWRKQYKDEFKDISNLYIAELTMVKKLLKVFSPDVVLNTFKENNLFTLRFLTKEESASLIFGLFKSQIEYLDTLSNLKKTELEMVDDKIMFIEQKTQMKKNAIAKGL